MVRRVFFITTSILLFIFSLKLVLEGTDDLNKELQDTLASGPLGCLGLGWLLASVVLSGSPVAASALVLVRDGLLSAQESFAMIVGSRLGASFVVLALGALYDLRFSGKRGGAYVGALAFFVTATIYLPALGIGLLTIETGVIDHIGVRPPDVFVDVLDIAFGPVVAACKNLLVHLDIPVAWLVLVGVILIVVAFQVFDLALPKIDPLGGKLGQMATTIYRPSIGFLFGMLVTCITLSVSISLGLLVPLTVRGIIRRENLTPYILGANITTFSDTLAISLLVDHASAFAIVLCSIAIVTAISLPIVFFFYRPYERIIDSMSSLVVSRRWVLGVFLLGLLLLPLTLFLLSV